MSPMDSEYQQFQFPAANSFSSQYSVNLQTGVKRTLVYVPYGLLLLLLFILLLLTGIKFSQLHEEIQDVNIHLKTLSHEWETYTGDVEEDILVVLKEITPVQGRCKPGWVSFESSCYLYSSNTSTWSQAEQQCASRGGHLLVLNTIGELDYISKTISIHRNYWIGLEDRSYEGKWSWVDGTDFDPTIHQWDIGQPDNWIYRDGDEDCGQIHNSAYRIRKRLNDNNCKRSYGYICEARV